MALLSVNNLEKSFGPDLVFQNVSFEIQANDRIGLVGINGCGKSTLLKILTGHMSADHGFIHGASNLNIGYMEQHAHYDPNKNVYDETLTIFQPLIQMELELEHLHTQIHQDPKPELLQKQADLTEQFGNLGGLTYRARTRSALMGLGFDEDKMHQMVHELSGGQRAKIQLAKLLLSRANLLLLDEPTNHLDMKAVEWVEDYLRAFQGAFLLISHDRYLLDRVTNRTFSLSHGHLYLYKGNYSQSLQQKAVDDLAAMRKYQKTKHEIERLEGVVKQQLQWNREKSVKRAESKMKSIERLEKTLQKPQSADRKIHFQLNASRRAGDEVLLTDDIKLSFGEQVLFQDLSIQIHRGDRIFLVGPNGCGKTSLLKTLIGQYHADRGYIQLGAGVDIGYYDQTQADLDETKTVLDELWDRYPQKTETAIRSALASFLFFGDDVYKSISTLSGGERARVLLLRLMLSKANFLILDEPTNHLDIAACETLEQALDNYAGTLLIVTHDRHLINALATRIYAFDPDGIREYVGNYEFYLANRPILTEETIPASKEQENIKKTYKQQAAERRKTKAAQARLEAVIEKHEQKIQSVTQMLSNANLQGDYQEIMRLDKELQTLQQEGDDLLTQWTILSEELERLTVPEI